MIRIINIRGELNDDLDAITAKIKKMLNTDNVHSVKIINKAIDARKKHDIHYIYSAECETDNDTRAVKHCKNASITEKYEYSLPCTKKLATRPVVVGFGPAGMFAALVLAQNGYEPIVLERGKRVDKRTKDINRFWSGGELNESSNVQFGEGGAGTFSDGKLTTNIKDERIKKVLDEFVKHGAPEEILYLAKPHIGTDKLRETVASIRKEIIALGGEVRFESCVTDIKTENGAVVGIVVNGTDEIRTDSVILACGHSARDTFEMLKGCGVIMEQKPFSVGVRIEHSQQAISYDRYGDMYTQLPPADYKLAVHLPNGRSCYTFCMCPGGYVIASASEKNTVVTNGMSNFARDGKNANSAVLVGVYPSDYGSDDPLAGVDFQRKIERGAYMMSGSYKAPAQLFGDFAAGKPSLRYGGIEPTYKPGVTMCDIRGIFPEFVTQTLKLGIEEMDKRIKGFARYDAVMTAPETRSSSPVRIVRDKETFKTSIKGLYSAGEGGGHAGGITSAAVDGIRTAEKLLENY